MFAQKRKRTGKMSSIKSYRQALEYIFSKLPVFQRQGPKALKYDLSNIERFSAALGNPHLKFKSIHIAGTNGKGTVAHALASVFQEAGYKTGLYTSPHYKDYRERIKINGKYIAKAFVKDFIKNNHDIIESLEPSYFELSVAMAFKYFADRQVDIAIVETGLGGRLDSTNIITPLMSVITNISLDHTQTLGADLTSIAKEKAGIIKPYIPVVIGERQKETGEVFLSIAKQKHAPLCFAGDMVEVKYKDENRWYTGLEISSALTDIKYLKTDLKGPFSAVNIKYALASLLCFREKVKDFEIKDEHITGGLRHIKRNTGYKGRWHVLSGKRYGRKDVKIIADGAHNFDAVRKTVDYVKSLHYNKLHIILGVVADKEWDKVMRILPADAIYYFTKADIPRAMESEKLKNAAAKYGLRGEAYGDIKAALEKAVSNAGKDDLILIMGSIYLVGEII